MTHENIGEEFDIVAADVPCSGEGMMRKNNTAVSQWSPRLTDECARLQREIVQSVWKALRPGGYLIYSTCTFNIKENEENARWIADSLGGLTVDLGLSDFAGVVPAIGTDLYCARFLPGKIDGEGQFITVFKKPGILEENSFITSKTKKLDFPAWLDGEFSYLTLDKGDVFAVRSSHHEFVKRLMKKINVMIPGVHFAVTKGRDLIPAQALATSVDLNMKAFPMAETDYASAMAYLRGEAIHLDGDVPKGIVLVSHGGNRLGWAKNLGNRANNLFPAGQRIRSPHIPLEEPSFL